MSSSVLSEFAWRFLHSHDIIRNTLRDKENNSRPLLVRKRCLEKYSKTFHWNSCRRVGSRSAQSGWHTSYNRYGASCKIKWHGIPQGSGSMFLSSATIAIENLTILKLCPILPAGKSSRQCNRPSNRFWLTRAKWKHDYRMSNKCIQRNTFGWWRSVVPRRFILLA